MGKTSLRSLFGAAIFVFIFGLNGRAEEKPRPELIQAANKRAMELLTSANQAILKTPGVTEPLGSFSKMVKDNLYNIQKRLNDLPIEYAKDAEHQPEKCGLYGDSEEGLFAYVLRGSDVIYICNEGMKRGLNILASILIHEACHALDHLYGTETVASLVESSAFILSGLYPKNVNGYWTTIPEVHYYLDKLFRAVNHGTLAIEVLPADGGFSALLSPRVIEQLSKEKVVWIPFELNELKSANGHLRMDAKVLEAIDNRDVTCQIQINEDNSADVRSLVKEKVSINKVSEITSKEVTAVILEASGPNTITKIGCVAPMPPRLSDVMAALGDNVQLEIKSP